MNKITTRKTKKFSKFKEKQIGKFGLLKNYAIKDCVYLYNMTKSPYGVDVLLYDSNLKISKTDKIVVYVLDIVEYLNCYYSKVFISKFDKVSYIYSREIDLIKNNVKKNSK